MYALAMNVCGQEFTEEIIGRIRQVVGSAEKLTRCGLARKVCEWLGWRHHDGRLKEMNCRSALVKLSRRGIIELPEAKKIGF